MLKIFKADMKPEKYLLVIFCFVTFFATAQDVEKVTNPVEWINPLMGTDSKFDLSNGNTCPESSIATINFIILCLHKVLLLIPLWPQHLIYNVVLLLKMHPIPFPMRNKKLINKRIKDLIILYSNTIYAHTHA